MRRRQSSIREPCETKRHCLGREDSNTLNSAAIEGPLLYLQWNFAIAEAMYSDAVEATERVLLKSHPTYISRVRELQLICGNRLNHYFFEEQ